MHTISYLLKGVRFYIAIAILLVSVDVVWWTYTLYGTTPLFTIRTEEVFAWLSLFLLIFALLIGPTCKIFPNLPGKKILFDSRRLIGIGAAWFALLHVLIAYVGLLKTPNPLHLPKTYGTSIILGAISLLILLLMAFTSFDAAFSKMGVWWFRLHRFVYLALTFSIIHALIIGSHATSTLALLIIGISVALILTLHTFAAIKSPHQKVSRYVIIGLCSIALLWVLGYGYNQNKRNNFYEISPPGAVVPKSQ